MGFIETLTGAFSRIIPSHKPKEGEPDIGAGQKRLLETAVSLIKELKNLEAQEQKLMRNLSKLEDSEGSEQKKLEKASANVDREEAKAIEKAASQNWQGAISDVRKVARDLMAAVRITKETEENLKAAKVDEAEIKKLQAAKDKLLQQLVPIIRQLESAHGIPDIEAQMRRLEGK
ncbi:MAG: hypothetical protein ABH829_00750 [archaeon]